MIGPPKPHTVTLTPVPGAVRTVPVTRVPTTAPDPAAEELPRALPKTREQKRFGRYDKDRDGAITRDEYLASRRKAYAKLDTNGDGRLSFALLMSDPARPGIISPEVSIDPDDQERARSIAQALRAVVGDNVPRDVALAAAIELAAAIAEEGDNDDEPVRAAGGAR